MAADDTSDHGTQARALNALKDLYRQLERAIEEAGDGVSRLVDEVAIRQRLSDAIDALDDVRLEILRRVRGDHATPELDEMTVKELRDMARTREIPGRSTMNKAELIEALRR